MALLDELSANGSNTTEGLSRLMNNASLYERLLKKLPGSVKPLEVLPHIENGDIKQAIANAHTIKGVTGNLSITPLYTAYTKITDLLRIGSIDEARNLTVETLPVQEKILTIIEKYS